MNKRNPTPAAVRRAVEAYKAFRRAERKADRLQEKVNQLVERLDLDGCNQYVELTDTFDAKFDCS